MKDRRHIIEKLRAQVLRRGLPRFEMTVIVAGTGLAGFVASAGLLAMGVSSMTARYPLSVLIAYGVFLCLVRLWIGYHRRHGDSVLDVVDLTPDFVPTFDGTPAVQPWSGEGGDFGGGGASATWDSASIADTSGSAGDFTVDATPSAFPDAAGSIFDVDLDDGWIIVVPIAILLAGLFAAVYVVYAAPVLLAEVLLDVLLVSGLRHRLQKVEPQYWLSTAIRRTWLPVLAVVIVVAVSGFVMERIVPGAHSIGDVVGAAKP